MNLIKLAVCVGERISAAEILMIGEEALGGAGLQQSLGILGGWLQRHCLAELKIPGKA